MNKELRHKIALLEKLTGFKVKLVENEEASKNLATAALKQVSETLDLLKSNIDMATSKLEVLSSQDSALTKLRGMGSIVDANITEIAEIIAEVTGLSTEEDQLGIDNNPGEGLEDDQLEEDVEISTDDAIKNVDKVKQLAQNDVQVVLKDKGI